MFNSRYTKKGDRQDAVCQSFRSGRSLFLFQTYRQKMNRRKRKTDQESNGKKTKMLYIDYSASVGLLFWLWQVYDNFPQNTIILSLWYDNPTFPTWQRWSSLSGTLFKGFLRVKNWF